jgi:hypothetical protein
MLLSDYMESMYFLAIKTTFSVLLSEHLLSDILTDCIL